MAETWTCPKCDTVNGEDSANCIVCRTRKVGAGPVERPPGEAPRETLLPEEAPLTPPPSSRLPPPEHSWPASPRPTAPGSGPAEPSPVIKADLRSRRVATGKVLGIGHVGLFAAAFVFLLAEIGLGRAVLRFFYFTIASIPAWQAGPVIHQAIVLLDILPLAVAKWFYLLLAVACLVMRLSRSMPGPLSLVIAIPAALYGVLVALAELPVFVDYWLLALPAVIGSCFVVAKTLPEPPRVRWDRPAT